jgi:subtilisin family serine protease
MIDFNLKIIYNKIMKTIQETALTVIYCIIFIVGMIASNVLVNKVFGATLENRVKIAVIDTGISSTSLVKPYLCAYGHRDYTETGLGDSDGHGTNIAGIIAKKMDSRKECLVIYKYTDKKAKKPYNNEQLNLRMALADAFNENVKYVNYSGGGAGEDLIEKDYIQKMLANGVVVSVAAGNDHTDLSKNCYYYPACYSFQSKNWHVVDNGNGVYRHASSNWGGPVTNRENGENIEGAGIALTGTSQATAVLTGKIIEANRR